MKVTELVPGGKVLLRTQQYRRGRPWGKTGCGALGASTAVRKTAARRGRGCGVDAYTTGSVAEPWRGMDVGTTLPTTRVRVRIRTACMPRITAPPTLHDALRAS